MVETGLLRIAAVVAATIVVWYGTESSSKPIETPHNDAVVAAAEGRLVFDNTTIGAAVEVFNRYNVVQLHVADAKLAQQRISGVFEARRPESFVAFIQSVVKVRVSHDGLVTTLTSL